MVKYTPVCCDLKTTVLDSQDSSTPHSICQCKIALAEGEENGSVHSQSSKLHGVQIKGGQEDEGIIITEQKYAFLWTLKPQMTSKWGTLS